MVGLKPLENEGFSTETKQQLEEIAKMQNKRLGGGSVQMNIIAFEQLAKIIVPVNKGYDKQSGKDYSTKQYVLRRVFSELGWPEFDKAVILAVVRRDAQGSDGFIPFCPGMLDIEAGQILESGEGHREIIISGRTESPDEEFQRVLSQIRFGLAQEHQNGSLEVIIPRYTPGLWQKIEDFELGRKTGIVIVTSHVTLYCEGLMVNNLVEMPKATVKVTEAISIARSLL